VVAVGNSTEEEEGGKQEVTCFFISHENLARLPIVELEGMTVMQDDFM
jgi:hypothetical protein